MVHFLRLFLLVILCSLVGTALFTVLFWVDFARDLVPILMYRGLLIGGLAAVVHMLLLLGLRRIVPFIHDAIIVGAVSVAAAVNLIFLVVIPVTIDRSVTVYLLGQLARAPEGLTESQLRNQLVNQYVDEYGAVDRRMREQILSSNVIELNGRFRLSAQGVQFIRFSRFVGGIFGADLRFIQQEPASETQTERDVSP